MLRWKVTLALAVSLIGLTGAARAQDRPDLPDFAQSDIFDVVNGTDNKIKSFVVDPGNAGYDIFAYGEFYAQGGPGHFLQIEWTLSEPDKVKRKPAQIQLQQGAHVLLYVNAGSPALTTDISGTGSPTGCKMSLKFKDQDGDGMPAQQGGSAADKTTWKIQCTDVGLAGLGLTPAQVQSLKTIISNFGAGSGSTILSGSTQ